MGAVVQSAISRTWGLAKAFLRWVWSGRLEIAIWAGIFAFFYQALATQMQAEALSWEMLTSESSVGHFGKVKALEQLNRDSTIPLFYVPDAPDWVPSWSRISVDNRGGTFFSIDENGYLRMPFFWLFRGRTDLQGLVLSRNASDPSNCPTDGPALGGLRLPEAKLAGADFTCVNFGDAIQAAGSSQEQGGNTRGVDFSGARLVGAKFSGATLPSANFADAEISGAQFDYADLSLAVFNGAVGSRVHLLHLDFDRAAPQAYEARSDAPREKVRNNETGEELAAGKDSQRDSSNIDNDDNSCSSDICFVAACLNDSDIHLGRSERTIYAEFRNATLTSATFSGQSIDAKFGPLNEKDLLDIRAKRFSTCKAKGQFATQAPATSRTKTNSSPVSGSILEVMGADLTRANMENIDWESSDFSKANITGANFFGANLRDTDGITPEILAKACTDSYTLLPKESNKGRKALFDKAVFAKKRAEHADRNPNHCHDATTVETRNEITKQPCPADARVLPQHIDGVLVGLIGEVLKIELADCDKTVLFDDSSMSRELLGKWEFGTPNRTSKAEAYSLLLANNNLMVRCVQFSPPPKLVSADISGVRDASSASDSQSGSNIPQGWCSAHLESDGQVSLAEAIKALSSAPGPTQKSSATPTKDRDVPAVNSDKTPEKATECDQCKD